MNADTPSEADVIRAFIAEALGSMHTACAGYVVAYDRASQTADVQPAVRGRQMLADASIVEVDLPVLKGVPVVFFVVTFDLLPGDPCVVMFADRSHDEWKGNGAGRMVSTADPRRFDLSDAFVLPGGRPPAAPLPATAYAAGAVVVPGADIRLGSSAASAPVALSTLIATVFSTLKTWLDTHTHAGVTVGGGVTSPPVAPSPAAASVAAVKVKAE